MKKVNFILLCCLTVLLFSCSKKPIQGEYTTTNIDGKVAPFEKIIFNDNSSFELSVNLCEGYGKVNGKFEVKEKNILLTELKMNFAGYTGDDSKELKFEIISDNEIKFLSDGFGCGPMANDVFKK